MNTQIYIYLVFIFLVLFFITDKNNRKFETFINVTDAHNLYNRYRSYIDINYNHHPSKNLVLQQNKQCKLERPPKISTTCYNDKLNKCLESRNNTCHYMAFNSCIIPIIN